MEKLINILPNLITNEDSDWLKKKITNPDDLTQELMGFFNAPLYQYSFLNLLNFDPNMLDGLNDNSTVDEIIEKTSKLDNSENYAQLLEELKTRFDCEDKKASTIIWLSAILNNLENKDVNPDAIKHALTAVCYSLQDSQRNIKDLCNDLREVVQKSPKLEEAIKTYVSYALLLNEEIQSSDTWFDFDTLDSATLSPTMKINSKEDLLQALSDKNNYQLALDYIRANYLSEREIGKDGYCSSEDDQNYKAYLIIFAIANETYKHLPDFDKDNFIGLNLTAKLLAAQERLSSSHILSGISNELNALEDQAGRIASLILGRSIFKESAANRFRIPKAEFKVGNKDAYIKSNINAFGKLIAPNLDYCEDLLKTITHIEHRYEGRTYKGSNSVEDTLNYLANELGIDLTKKSEEKIAQPTADVAIVDEKAKEPTADERLRENLATLKTEALRRYDELNRMEKIYSRVKSSQKTNLDIDDLSFDKKLLKKDEVIATDLHERVIKEYYRALSMDPILKGNTDDRYRIKTPKMILSELKNSVYENEEYPELSRLMQNFQISQKDELIKMLDEKYVNVDGTTNPEYDEVYHTVANSKKSKNDKEKAILDSNLSEEEKERMTNML